MAIMAAGSLLAGARLVTSIIRGVEGAAVFGLLAWGLGSAIVGCGFMETKAQTKPMNGADRTDAGLKNE